MKKQKVIKILLITATLVLGNFEILLAVDYIKMQIHRFFYGTTVWIHSEKHVYGLEAVIITLRIDMAFCFPLFFYGLSELLL